MTVATEETTARDEVTCECGAVVAPTLPGGDRPRAHHDPNTNEPCLVPSRRTAAICKRCGGTPRSPKTVTRGGREVTCTSQVFHPQTWTERIDGADVEVGNAAACGEVCGVSGEQWQWLVRRPRGRQDPAPQPDGYNRERRTSFWRMDAARGFARTRPNAPAVR